MCLIKLQGFKWYSAMKHCIWCSRKLFFVPVFARIMQKCFLNCWLTNMMHSKTPEETTFILVILSGMYNAVYSEITLFQMLNLSGIYMYFLGVFSLPVVNHASCVTKWRLLLWASGTGSTFPLLPQKCSAIATEADGHCSHQVGHLDVILQKGGNQRQGKSLEHIVLFTLSGRNFLTLEKQ